MKMDETRLFEGATTDGERIAAGLARERIQERITRIAQTTRLAPKLGRPR